MAKLNTIIYEKLFYQNKTSSNLSEEKNIEYYLNTINHKIYDQNQLKDLLNFLSHLLQTMSCESFDLVSSKYLNKMNEVYKDLMNLIKKENEQILIFMTNLEELNFSLAKFFRIFHQNFQNYNEKHKNLIKLIPNVLKIYFKLFEETFFEGGKEINLKYLNLLKSFAVFSTSVINYFPTMMRGFESRLDGILKNIFTKMVLTNLFSDKIFVKIFTLFYAMLIRLSPDYNTKLNITINKIDENLKFFIKFFEPVSLKSKARSNEMDKMPNSIFLFNQASLKSFNLMQCKNLIFFLFKLKRTIFKTFPDNTEIEVNFSCIISQFSESIEIFSENKKSDDYIVEGLNQEDYRVFKAFLVIETFKTFSFVIENYSEYLYNYIPIIKNVLNKILVNFDHEYTNFYEVYISTLKLFESFIMNFDSKIVSSVQDIIFKFCMANFPELYVAFLERNDKTVIRMDQNYFKISKVKASVNFSKKKNVSLIQLAKNESLNEKIENYTNLDIETILIHFLKSIFY